MPSSNSRKASPSALRRMENGANLSAGIAPVSTPFRRAGGFACNDKCSLAHDWSSTPIVASPTTRLSGGLEPGIVTENTVIPQFGVTGRIDGVFLSP